MKIDLISGQKVFKNMTNKLSEEEYAKTKAQFWLFMLNDGNKPTKWLKPNASGTKVNFDYMKGQSEYDRGLLELEVYLHEINERFGLDYKFSRE
ncbi:hypothetical protein [Sporosarcina sp. FSL K6-1508]|uniref:hypothetical protein n=1 Tax=Sporosarcina sp. FSL K6-1508 TaxID=2921553 RepID=UPI0030F6177E